MKKILFTTLAYILASTAMHADTTNLLTNPGAETGSLAGWSVLGTPPSAVNIDPHTGNYDFAGGSGSSVLDQTVSLFTQGITPALVNTGGLSFQTTWWERNVEVDGPVRRSGSGGFGSPSLLVTLFDSAGETETYTQESQTNGAWTEYTLDEAIPVGTTAINYMIDFDGNPDAFVDDTSLEILGPTGTTPSPTPEPSTLVLFVTGLAGIAGAARRKLAA
jgi:PEP-CTERM motif